ncbi:MAG TPA: hypothetical protein VMG37_04150 [Solirubrobacteraceae bacterium]|nr:hypothetical protein [Solirubrobacteraceae bacterium]
MTYTFKPDFSPPLELLDPPELVELVAPAALLLADDELLEDPHAAMLTTAATSAAASPNDRPIRRPGKRGFPTSCI